MTLPADARIASIRVVVSDLDRSLRFYRETIGFQLIERRGDDATLGAAGGPVLLELLQRTDAIPRPRRSAGLYHFAILVPSRAALGRAVRRLADQRWSLTGAADHLVSEAVYLDDPDGLGVEIYRDRPRESWRVDGGQVAMATDPLDLEGVVGEPGAERAWQGLDRGTVIGHVHLQVAQLADAEAFYCGDIGFTPTLRRYPGALFVAAGGYHHHVGLNTWAGVGVPPPPEQAVGLRGVTVAATGVTERGVTDAATGVTLSLASA